MVYAGAEQYTFLLSKIIIFRSIDSNAYNISKMLIRSLNLLWEGCYRQGRILYGFNSEPEKLPDHKCMNV